MPQEFYKEEEAEAILRFAAQRSANRDISRAKLLATAAELGISPEEVEQAENLLAAQRAELESRAKFERHMKSGFYTHLITYLSVNAFLVLMNVLTGIHQLSEFWAAWSILGWGIGLVIHFGVAFWKSSSAYTDEYEKWKAMRGQAGDPHAHRMVGMAIRSGNRHD